MASARVGSPMMSCQCLGGQLGGEEGGVAAVAVLGDLEEVAPLLVRQEGCSPVVDDDEVAAQ